MTRLTGGHGVSTVAGRLTPTAGTELTAGIAAFSGLLGLSVARRHAGPRLTFRRWNLSTAATDGRPPEPATTDQPTPTAPQPARPVARRYENRSNDSGPDGDSPDQERTDPLPPLLRRRSVVRRVVRRLSGGGLSTLGDTAGPQVVPLGTEARRSGVARRLSMTSSTAATPGLVVVLSREDDSEPPLDGRRSTLRSVREAAEARQRSGGRSTPTMTYRETDADSDRERHGPSARSGRRDSQDTATERAPPREAPERNPAEGESRRPSSGHQQTAARPAKPTGSTPSGRAIGTEDPPLHEDRPAAAESLRPPTTDRTARLPTDDSPFDDRGTAEQRGPLSADTDRSFSRLYRRFRRRLETERRRRGL